MHRMCRIDTKRCHIGVGVSVKGCCKNAEQHHLGKLTGGLTLAAAMRGLSLWLCTVGDLAPGKKTAALALKLMSSLVPLGASPGDLTVAQPLDSWDVPLVP